MHQGTTTIRSALVAAGIAAVPAMAAAQISDAIRGAPGEADPFIGTAEGWEHPMAPWGEPGIRAMLDMMQASGGPLERCADSYRPDAEPCDIDQKWVPEEIFNGRM